MVLLVVPAMLATGCHGAPNHDAQAGTPVVGDGIVYSVQTSRELNPFLPDDRALLAGLPPRERRAVAGELLVGVFVQAQNTGSRPTRAVPAPRLVSAEGKTFLPLRQRGNALAYHGGTLAPGAEIPDPDSLPAEGPENAAALVYRLPAAAFMGQRPFVVRFGDSPRAISVQLDL